jgi:hypothetical protein
MSPTKDIQTTLDALKQQSDIARLPSFKATLPSSKLGNVATKLAFSGYGSFVGAPPEFLKN